MDSNWFKEMFIDEAKPAIERHSPYNTGYSAGFEAGEKSEYDKFWDRYQNYGNIKQIGIRMFEGTRFNKSNFYPKYDIKLTDTCEKIFYNWNYNTEQSMGNFGDFNLKQRLSELNITLDFSNATGLMSAFSYSGYLAHLPVIDARGLTDTKYGLSNTFSNMRNPVDLVIIDKLIVKEDFEYVGTFNFSSDLISITFEGVIGHDLNLQWSPLTPESMISVITHLKDYSGTDEVDTHTVTFNEKCWAALEAHSSAPDGNTWEEYVSILGWLS